MGEPTLKSNSGYFPYPETNMDYFRFPQMTEEEKSYCNEVLSKYKTQPEMDYTLPELVEWWDVDKVKQYKVSTRLREKVKEYQELLRVELLKDPHALVHWMIPHVFRVCWKYKVPCNRHRFLQDSEDGAYNESIPYYNLSYIGMPTPVQPPQEYFPKCVFNKQFYDSVVFVLETHPTYPTKLSIDTYVMSTPYEGNTHPLQIKLAQENKEFWDMVCSDVNKMLHAVATKTPYKSMSSDISNTYFTSYFPKIPTLSKRVRTAYVENDYTGKSIELDSQDILGILLAVKIAELEFVPGQSKAGYQSLQARIQQRKASAPPLHQKFNRYLSLLDVDQLKELLDFFEVPTDTVTPKDELVHLIQTIFRDVTVDETTELDQLWTKMLEQFVLTRESVSNLFESLKEQKKSAVCVRSFDSSKASEFYSTLYTNLSSFFTACSAISSGKVSHRRETGVKILGSVMDLVKLGWLVRAFDDYRKTERAKLVASQLKSPADLIADEIASRVTNRYASQIDRIDTDRIEPFAEHTFERMVKYIEKNSSDTLPFVDKFVRSVYLIELKNGFIVADKLNSEKWTADGIYLGVSMRTPDGTEHVSKRRSDGKYGVIDVDHGEEAMRLQ